MELVGRGCYRSLLTGPWWYQSGLPTPCKYTKSRLLDADITTFTHSYNILMSAPQRTPRWVTSIPTRHFHNLIASRSVYGPNLSNTETSCDGFWNSEVVKGPVGVKDFLIKEKAPMASRSEIHITFAHRYSRMRSHEQKKWPMLANFNCQIIRKFGQ